MFQFPNVFGGMLKKWCNDPNIPAVGTIQEFVVLAKGDQNAGKNCAIDCVSDVEHVFEAASAEAGIARATADAVAASMS